MPRQTDDRAEDEQEDRTDDERAERTETETEDEQPVTYTDAEEDHGDGRPYNSRPVAVLLQSPPSTSSSSTLSSASSESSYEYVKISKPKTYQHGGSRSKARSCEYSRSRKAYRKAYASGSDALHGGKCSRPSKSPQHAKRARSHHKNDRNQGPLTKQPRLGESSSTNKFLDSDPQAHSSQEQVCTSQEQVCTLQKQAHASQEQAFASQEPAHASQEQVPSNEDQSDNAASSVDADVHSPTISPFPAGSLVDANENSPTISSTNAGNSDKTVQGNEAEVIVVSSDETEPGTDDAKPPRKKARGKQGEVITVISDDEVDVQIIDQSQDNTPENSSLEFIPSITPIATSSVVATVSDSKNPKQKQKRKRRSAHHRSSESNTHSMGSLSPTKSSQTSSSLLLPARKVLSKQAAALDSASIPKELVNMKHIIFVDLDNWGGFWSRLFQPLPPRTFVWGFYGGKKVYRDPQNCLLFDEAKAHGLWHVHRKCSNRKDAADFTICMMAGKLDERLPHNIPFTVISGDKGFIELEEQMKTSSTRRVIVIDPHHVPHDKLYALICSVADV